MRCKVGDIVVVINDEYPENIGRFGTVVGRYDGRAHGRADWWVRPARKFFSWYESEPGVRSLSEDAADGSLADSDLRPIRDQDGEDESLTWADEPQEVAA